MFESRRSLSTNDLPPVLAINTSVFNQENIKFWIDTKKRRFLTPSVVLHGQIDGVDDPKSVVYELRVRVPLLQPRRNLRNMPGQSLVAQVVTQHGDSHLVAIVKGTAARESRSLRETNLDF